jgi:hypothetical protein
MLTVPAAELGKRLTKQILRGWAMVNREITSAQDLEKLRDDHHTWVDYNSTLIKRSFNTDEEYENYTKRPARISSPDVRSDPYQLLTARLKRDIRILKSLKDRLPLFDEISSVKMAVPQGEGHPSLSDMEPAIFLVHGRDDAAKHGVARFVRNITGIEPIILAEQPDLGQTVIEKFEKHASQVSYAIVLVTGDDEGRLKGDELMKPRARQNVILELGWFAGRLGRQKVAMLYEHDVDLPSDMGGVLYAELDPGEGWKIRLAREMRAAKLPVDMNKVV